MSKSELSKLNEFVESDMFASLNKAVDRKSRGTDNAELHNALQPQLEMALKKIHASKLKAEIDNLSDPEKASTLHKYLSGLAGVMNLFNRILSLTVNPRTHKRGELLQTAIDFINQGIFEPVKALTETDAFKQMKTKAETVLHNIKKIEGGVQKSHLLAIAK